MVFEVETTDPDGLSDTDRVTINVDAEVLPDAIAPTVSINAVPNGNENTTVGLSANISGGTYDEVDYAWEVSGGSLNNAASATPTWTRPSVNFNTNLQINLRITARGTGTIALDGSSAVRDAAERNSAVFNVVVIPDAVAPTVTLAAVGFCIR